MRKVTLTLGACMLFSFAALAQDGLPANPEPGKCYIRCITPDVWEDGEVEVLVKAACERLEVVDAEYRTETEQVLIKPAHKTIVCYPAEFRKETIEVVTEDRCSEFDLVQCTYRAGSVTIEVQPAYSRYEYQVSLENCKSEDPRDCMVLCYVEHPAEDVTVSTQEVANYASSNKRARSSITTKIVTDVLVKDAYYEFKDVPAQYRSVTKKVLVKDAEVRKVNVDAVYSKVKTRVLKTKGGLAVWEEIDCELTNFTLLPVFYSYGSATLTNASKRVIDEKILALMKAKPLIRVEINAHTDSRGSSAANLSLSQSRAKSVVDYLVSRGISRDRLVSEGYGESRLTNNCADGVDCSEADHAKNRRTEFRVLGG